MPGPKNGERPYLAVPEPTFWGAIFDLFWGIFWSATQLPHHHSTFYPRTCAPLQHTTQHFNPHFIILFTFISRKTTMVWDTRL